MNKKWQFNKGNEAIFSKRLRNLFILFVLTHLLFVDLYSQVKDETNTMVIGNYKGTKIEAYFIKPQVSCRGNGTWNVIYKNISEKITDPVFLNWQLHFTDCGGNQKIQWMSIKLSELSEYLPFEPENNQINAEKIAEKWCGEYEIGINPKSGFVLRQQASIPVPKQTNKLELAPNFVFQHSDLIDFDEIQVSVEGINLELSKNIIWYRYGCSGPVLGRGSKKILNKHQILAGIFVKIENGNKYSDCFKIPINFPSIVSGNIIVKPVNSETLDTFILKVPKIASLSLSSNWVWKVKTATGNKIIGRGDEIKVLIKESSKIQLFASGSSDDSNKVLAETLITIPEKAIDKPQKIQHTNNNLANTPISADKKVVDTRQTEKESKNTSDLSSVTSQKKSKINKNDAAFVKKRSISDLNVDFGLEFLSFTRDLTTEYFLNNGSSILRSEPASIVGLGLKGSLGYFPIRVNNISLAFGADVCYYTNISRFFRYENNLRTTDGRYLSPKENLGVINANAFIEFSIGFPRFRIIGKYFPSIRYIDHTKETFLSGSNLHSRSTYKNTEYIESLHLGIQLGKIRKTRSRPKTLELFFSFNNFSSSLSDLSLEKIKLFEWRAGFGVEYNLLGSLKLGIITNLNQGLQTILENKSINWNHPETSLLLVYSFNKLAKKYKVSN